MRRFKAVFTPIVLTLGTATFLCLLWQFDPPRVWDRLVAFGWGFAVLLPFQILDHMLNACGWKLSFPPAAAGRAGFWDLVRVRIAGDGVNYLTPSGNIAGEFVRPGMLKCDLPDEVKIASVFLAKVAQAVGQALFVIFGLGYVLVGRRYAFQGRQAAWGAAAMLAILGAVALGVWVFASEPPAWVGRRWPRAMNKEFENANVLVMPNSLTPGDAAFGCTNWSRILGDRLDSSQPAILFYYCYNTLSVPYTLRRMSAEGLVTCPTSPPSPLPTCDATGSISGPGSKRNDVIATNVYRNAGSPLFTNDLAINALRIKFVIGEETYTPMAGKPDLVNPQFIKIDTLVTTNLSYMNTFD